MSLDVIRPSEVLNADRIVAAVSVYDYGSYSRCYASRMYDDGSGRVYGYYESLGLLGVVRASSFESAYECVEDTIMDDADLTDIPNDPEADLPEGVSFRPNGGDPSLPWAKTGYACYDLNGNQLNLLPDEESEDRRHFLIVERDVLVYLVTVGNIGTVYTGADGDRADDVYREYVAQSDSHVGRAGDQDVTLWEDGEPVRECLHYDEEL